jgi:mannonate dehydratase
MRFDIADFAAFDIHILNAPAPRGLRPRSGGGSRPPRRPMDDAGRQALADAITMGLPGSTEAMDLARVREHLAEYGRSRPTGCAQHFIDFLVRGRAGGRGGWACDCAAIPTIRPSRCSACRG